HAGTGAVSSGSTRTPLRGLRRTIARKLTATHQLVPATSGFLEVDVTDLSEQLAGLVALAERFGVRLTWTAVFALATAQTIKQYPQFNASIDDETEEIVQHDKINLGIAVAGAAGLSVPVVRDAGSRSLLELASEINRLSAAVRDQTVTRDELTGG